MAKLPANRFAAQVPQVLQLLDRWVGYGKVDGKGKVPLNLRRPGKKAKSTDPSTWGTWKDALRWYERMAPAPDVGVGFVLTREHRIAFLDFDHALDPKDQSILPWAYELIAPWMTEAGSYTEVSPSGTGLHVFCTYPEGLEPLGGKDGATRKFEDAGVPGAKVEVFLAGRYSTITGAVVGHHTQVQERGLLLSWLTGNLGLDKAPEKVEHGDVDVDEVLSAASAISPDCDYQTWLEVGMGLKSALGEAGRSFWLEWSAQSPKYKSGEPQAKWDSFQRDGITVASLFHHAKAAGWHHLDVGRTTPEEDFTVVEVPPAKEDEPPLQPATDEEVETCQLHRHWEGPKKDRRLVISEGHANLVQYLRHSNFWRGRIKFNDRFERVEVDGKTIDNMVVGKMARGAQWFCEWKRSPSPRQLVDAVDEAALYDKFDPVKLWLEGLKWDGVKRLEGVPAVAGLEDNEDTRRCVQRWMVGAVARVFEPGVEMQSMLVLWGEQGTKKSTFFKTLAMHEEWYSESKVDMESKDGQLMLLGPWIVEVAELAGMSKASVEHVKVFIAEAWSRFRKPFGRLTERHPRRCVLAGSANHEHVLRDSSGSRRFWLVEAPALHVGALVDVREQLWAEAVVEYRAGTRWWDEGEEVQATNARNERHYERTALDTHAEAALRSLEKHGASTMAEVVTMLAEARQLPPGFRERDLGAVFKRLGWTETRLRVDGAPRRVWVAPAGAPGGTHEAKVLAFRRSAAAVPGFTEVVSPEKGGTE